MNQLTNQRGQEGSSLNVLKRAEDLEAKQNMYEEAATQLIEQYVEENGGYTVSGLEEDETPTSTTTSTMQRNLSRAGASVRNQPQAIAQRNLYEAIGKAK